MNLTLSSAYQYKPSNASSGPIREHVSLWKHLIGTRVERHTAMENMARAHIHSGCIPDLMVEAKQVANNVFAGWHGRRRRGMGENFWQFRPYVHGETMAAIDWRRSARDDNVYIRDKEWQAVHTISLWVDESPSMLFRSRYANESKQSRALLIALAMAELLARSGERLGWLGDGCIFHGS